MNRALSDVEREGVISLMINEINPACVPVYQNVSKILSESSATRVNPDRADEAPLNLIRAACSGASMIVKEELVDFVRSLERRLNRDIRRIYEYYEILKEETIRTIEKKVTHKKGLLEANAGDSLIQTPEQLTTTLQQSSPERKASIGKRMKERPIKGLGKLFNKLDAIETERKWKLQDLILKYALKIELEPITVVSLETVSTVFWLEIKRRLSTRQFPLTFNPIVRQLDPLPCESCFYPRPAYYVCDNKLHIVCARCFGKCSQCGKQSCSVCYKSGCPKCGKKKTTVVSRK